MTDLALDPPPPVRGLKKQEQDLKGKVALVTYDRLSVCPVVPKIFISPSCTPDEEACTEYDYFG